MRWAGAVFALATVAAVGAGCGGGETDGSGATPAATDYASCLRANGITLPSGGPDARPSGRPDGRPSGAPGFDGGPGGAGRPSGTGRPSGLPSGRPGFGFGGTHAPNGVDQETWEKAQQACEGLRPSGGPGGPGGTGNGDNGALTAYRNCLSDHGVTVTGRIDDLDANDPEVAAAMQACAPLRPSNAPGPTSSPSG
jgi:hypothetical protein